MQNVPSLVTEHAVLLQPVCLCAVVPRFLGFPRSVSVLHWVSLKPVVLPQAAHFKVA